MEEENQTKDNLGTNENRIFSWHISCLQATQSDNVDKTANAVVQVIVGDVNDSPPVFDKDKYLVKLLENSPNDDIVLRVIVTDADEVLSFLYHSTKSN